MCPMCASAVLTFLGALGNLLWFRCRACGMDCSQDADQNTIDELTDE